MGWQMELLRAILQVELVLLNNCDIIVHVVHVDGLSLDYEIYK